MKKYINEYFNRVNEIFNQVDHNQLHDVVNLMIEVFKGNNTVYVAGNGGSASTASHMQSDFGFFLRKFTEFRPKVVSIVDNSSLITSIANDTSYEYIFMEQLKGKFGPNDMLIVFSASGNSLNLIKAVEYANSIKGNTVAFTGFDGGVLHNIVDCSVHTPNDLGDYGPIEDMHLIFNHIIFF